MVRPHIPCVPQLFIDAMITGMDAHLRYFERSLALFHGLQPYLQHRCQGDRREGQVFAGAKGCRTRGGARHVGVGQVPATASPPAGFIELISDPTTPYP